MDLIGGARLDKSRVNQLSEDLVREACTREEAEAKAARALAETKQRCVELANSREEAKRWKTIAEKA